jgi:3'(2'), 5'-bisphosphate nucleotidase
MILGRELEVARAAALEAAGAVRTLTGTSLAVERKAGNEPVTAADHAANDIIVRHLRDAFPGDALLSEEIPDDGARLQRPRVWMVDPIDGTREFIRGNTGYAVMIGLCVAGRPCLGVVVLPASGVVWTGVVGKGAWREEVSWNTEPATGARTPVRTSTLAGPPGIRLVSSMSYRMRDEDRFWEALAIEDNLKAGSVGYKACLVAEGSRDLYVYTGSLTKKWDTCGPEAILVAAGGRMTDTRGKPLSYVDQDLENRDGIVASNGPLHDQVIATLAELPGGAAS